MGLRGVSMGLRGVCEGLKSVILDPFWVIFDPFWEQQLLKIDEQTCPKNHGFLRSFSDHFWDGFWKHFGSNKSSDFQKMELRRRPLKQRRFGGAFWVAFGVSGGRFWLIFESLEVKFDGFRSQWGLNFSKHGG